MRRVWTFLSLGLALLLVVATTAASPAQEPGNAPYRAEYTPGRLLISLRSSDQTKMDRLVKRVAGKVVATLPTLGVTAIDVPPDQTESALKTLLADPEITYVERDPLVRLSSPTQGWRPDDPLFDRQWALNRLGIPQAWDVIRGDPSIVVAVLDTGANLDHEDLRGQLAPGWDFVRKGPTPEDDNGHGTHVSGLVAAAADNSIGISGVAPGSRVMPIKVVTAGGVGSHLHIAQGIEHAVRNGAKIINLSLGGGEPSETLRRAIDYAWDSGLLIIAAAGNENSSATVYPAAWPNVIGVGATNEDDSRAPFSNYGPYVSVVAPGVAILSTIKDPPYYEAWPGTSMSTPLVSGVAALLWSRYPTMSNIQIRNLLFQTTDRVGATLYDINGRNPEYGYGLVNAASAVGLAIVTPTPNLARPTATPTPCPIPALLPEEQALVEWINIARLNEGLPPVTIDMRLVEAARAHSRDMAANQRLVHTGSDGSTPQERMAQAGYQYAEASQLIAGGESNARAIVNLWLNSDQGHREIILAPWDDIGVGFVTSPDAIYYYYWTVKIATRQASMPVATPVRGLCPTVSPVTRTPIPPLPTITPTPTPTPAGLWYVELRPPPQAVGWVRSDQPHRGNWGDDDTYSGSLAGLIFHGAVQFDLTQLPANARIQRAQLILTGQDEANRRAGGQWAIRLLGADADYGWTSHGYTVVHGVSVVDTIGVLNASELGEGKTNNLEFTVGQVLELQQRRLSTGLVSFRFDGPLSGDNLFSWDSGQGSESRLPGPVLRVAFALDGPPPPERTPATPTPTPTLTSTPLPPTIAPTPTPGPDGSITIQIAARPADTGWLVSAENRGNHLGDDDIYVGLFDNAQYLGALQFDIGRIPSGATINWATLFLLGRSHRYTLDAGDYRVSLLDSATDLAWPSLTYARLRDARTAVALTPTWRGANLRAGQPNFLQFIPPALDELARRASTTRRLSLRLEGPSVGVNNLFSWNSGAEGAAPVLTINFIPPSGIRGRP